VSFVGAGAVTQTGVGSVVLPMPAGVAAGDTVLCFAWSVGASTSRIDTSALPSGWTALSVVAPGTPDQQTVLLRHVAGGSEPATYTFPVLGGATLLRGVLFAYRGLDTSSGLVGAGVSPVSGGGVTFPCPSVALTTWSDVYVGIVADFTNGQTSAAPGTAIEQIDQSTPSFHLALFDLRPLVEGDTGLQIATMTLASGTGVAAAYAFKAAAPPLLPGATDHVAAAIARLPHMYRGASSALETNTQKVLRALLSPAAALESAMRQVLTLRSIDTAVGAQLEAIGDLVGMPRQSVADDEIYRRYVRAAIATNKSDGVTEDILTIARLVVNDGAATLSNKNQGIAAFVLVVGGIAFSDAVATVLVTLLRRAAADGVRPVLEYSASTPSTTFTFDTGPGYDVGHYATALE
jgi:hypothetical protein